MLLAVSFDHLVGYRRAGARSEHNPIIPGTGRRVQSFTKRDAPTSAFRISYGDRYVTALLYRLSRDG
jgi:hypothetical protein